MVDLSKATPRPWFQRNMKHYCTYGIEWVSSDSIEHIAICNAAASRTSYGFRGFVSAEEVKANAALIVAAVNAYDPERERRVAELVAALEKIEGGHFSGKVVDALIVGDWHPAVTQAQDIARVALAAFKES